MDRTRLRRTYGSERFSRLGIGGVQLFGYQKYLGAQPQLPDHAHPHCIELCYLARGRQCFRVEGRNFWMTGGQVFATFPGEVHSSGEQPMEKSELYWLIIDLQEGAGFLGLAGPVADRVRDGLGSLSRRLFAVEPGIATVLADLEGELRGGAATPLAVHTLLCRFVDAAIEGGRQRTTGDVQRFEPVLQYIEANLDGPLRVADLAAVAGLSEPRFKAAFKSACGMSPAEYVARERIEQAKRRLRNPAARVTDIACDLGFSTPQYFSYVFRRFTGKSPRQFRLQQSGSFAPGGDA
jgi:AraC-like DNA-binding protein/quercetin dioxygenase-like cupin family protein